MKVTAMSVNMMEAASPSLIPKDRRSTQWGNLNKPYGVALDPLRGSLYVPNDGTSSVTYGWLIAVYAILSEKVGGISGFDGNNFVKRKETRNQQWHEKLNNPTFANVKCTSVL